jgi:ABC-type bacteriocin/lantibiotic exporter with double-glycine peptidase domain
MEVAKATAFNNWVSYSNKYVIEATLLLGGMIIAAIQFIVADAVTAISILALFLAAAMRMAPAALRIQQSLNQARACLYPANQFLLLADFLDEIALENQTILNENLAKSSFNPEIKISNLTVRYRNSHIDALSDINLVVQAGEFLAVTGESGSGKSTLIDALLNIVPIQCGKILISGLNPSDCFSSFPGSISYLPQETFIANSSIRDNVTFGYPKDFFSDSEIMQAMNKAEILEFALSLPEQLETILSENGSRLSGGQRQRIGLARALLTNPKLIILDEATSSLDAQTEFKISETIKNLGSEITRIVIAHRLTSIKEADRVVVMKEGEIIQVGKPSEILGYPFKN